MGADSGITIGIWVYEEPWGLQRTLDSLQLYTPSVQLDLVLLPDGPDPTTSEALSQLKHLPQIGTAQPLGGAACFNRLITCNDSDIYIFLESGCTVTNGWLTRILTAMNTNPGNGLAGPSTNRAWNQQCVTSYRGNDLAKILRYGQKVSQRYGNAWETLGPLYSLSEFCYVVKRDVVDAVGAADEGYGLGPSWEMDYNIRAQRAGYSGIWVCGAYVHRAQFTPRREITEATLGELSKRRYQDKFCALNFSNKSAGYKLHCRGDACENFAPLGLVRTHIPLQSKPSDRPQSSGLDTHDRRPLVSCIMPTRGRKEFVLQSIRYFQRQDYPNLELIIVDDGPEKVSSDLPNDPRVRYFHTPSGLSVGGKRNWACQLARGSIIAQWDDDDWYSPDRLSVQVEPLLAGTAEISAYQGTVFFDLHRWEFWTCTPELHRRLFVEDVPGGTLVYFKRVWEDLARYPDVSLAEDARFLIQAMTNGARLARLPNQGNFIYLRHGENTWSFKCGQFLDPKGWRRIAEPKLYKPDREFYATHSPAAPQKLSGVKFHIPNSSETMVSCIMPTAGRRDFLPQAIQYFMRQDYPHRELIIVDDGEDSIADLVPASGLVRYIRLEQRRSIGAKRNIACANARGNIIMHWDDDDWMAPWRISVQVEQLLGKGADICGVSRPLFYHLEDDEAWQYVYPEQEKPWVYGATFCYTKSLWDRNPFLDVGAGEDTKFVWSQQPKKVLALPNTNLFVGLIHNSNTDRNKRPVNSRWRRRSTASIQRVLQDDWDYYQSFRSLNRT